MKISKIMKCLPSALGILIALAASVAAAQQYGGDAGAYTILHAEYGTERNHVDVTNRLRDLARSDRDFRMGNSTFGVDPDEGRVKTLRIYARGPNGERRMFEYREGSVVDGSQFNGWGRGDWGNNGWRGGWEGENVGLPGVSGDSGGYRIMHAEYGTERHHVDVTNRLRELARADRVFRMGNSTFGVDPDEGRVKTLRIYARGPEGPRMFEFREGSTVDGSQFTGWGRGDWGDGGWNGGWNGENGDGNGGGGFGGGGYGNDAGDSGMYVILRAEYGTDRRRVDVTDRLRELARRDRAFRMGNSTFGVDPDHGRIKTLRIYARGPNGEQRTFDYREGSTVDGSQFKGWSSGNWRY
jgi:hypothetical protein